MIAALLIGRRGSIGFPGKNLYRILGHPLAYYPMMAAKQSAYVDAIYISTDCPGLMELAKSLDVEIIKRPAHLCQNASLGEDVFVHGYREIQERVRHVELMVLLFCNSATVTSEMVDEGIIILRKNTGLDSVTSVSKYNMWSPLRARKIGEDGLLHPFVSFEAFGNPEHFSSARDSQGDAYFADMSLSIVRPRCLEHIENGLLPQRWMGRKIYPLINTSGCDIDYEWQVPAVEYWLKKNWKVRQNVSALSKRPVGSA